MASAGDTDRLETGRSMEYSWGRGKNLFRAHFCVHVKGYSPVILGGLPVAKAPY